MSDSELTRDPKTGQFLPGKSGNPAGRPATKKNRITELKQELEVAVRENVSQQDVLDIVSAMVKEAKNGSVQAAKLILDKTVSNAKGSEESHDTEHGVAFIIENLTVNPRPEEKPHTIDVTPEGDE